MGSIPELYTKIKNRTEDGLREWGVGIIVMLVGLGSFGLGRLSVVETPQGPVTLLEASSSPETPQIPLGGQLVAARTGTVYYYPWCAGAAKITPEKQVWFPTEAAAQKAGFRAAKNCKGLGGETPGEFSTQ